MAITPTMLDRESDPDAEDLPSVKLDAMARLAPVFVLASPRSFTSIVCAMLGQHPDLYGFPETQLFTTETIAEKIKIDPQAPDRIRNGLLRVVAQLYFGEQTESSVTLARAWLRRRAHLTTGYVFELLARRVYPLTPVEKSPDYVYDINSFRRAFNFFPNARFIHLLRHPRGYCESNLRYYQGLREPPPPWMLCGKEISGVSGSDGKDRGDPTFLDPQRGWFLHNIRIRKFLESVPQAQKVCVRGEDLLCDPDRGLSRIANWLGVPADPEAIEGMKHPERSDYAFIGPRNARYGNSPSFLDNPTLRPEMAKSHSLDGSLPWRPDNCGFLPPVRELAAEYGYN
jgi:hypothetical protein